MTSSTAVKDAQKKFKEVDGKLAKAVADITKDKKEVKNIIINLKEFTQDLNLIQQRQAEIRNAVFSLDIFPERYPIYKTNNEIYYFRKMVTKHYIILYSIKNKTVIVNKILAQGMNI